MNALRQQTFTFGKSRGAMLEARLAYIERHGAAFLFNNTPPPVPGYPRPFRASSGDDGE